MNGDPATRHPRPGKWSILVLNERAEMHPQYVQEVWSSQARAFIRAGNIALNTDFPIYLSVDSIEQPSGWVVLLLEHVPESEGT